MGQIYGKIFEHGGYSPSQIKIVQLVGTNKKVLELGASTGYMTRLFKKNGCDVDIVEADSEDAKKASKWADETFVGSLDDAVLLKSIKGRYDVVVAADVLEHLKNPQEILGTLKKNLKEKGKVVISLPNTACWKIRRDLFFYGSFEYRESGILDKSHLRFYTYKTIQKMVLDSGYKVYDIYPKESSYPFKEHILKLGRFGAIANRLFENYLMKVDPNLFVSHIVMEVGL